MRKQTTIKKSNVVFGFFYQYWITIVLLVVLVTLIRQNFIINQFPGSLVTKQQIIDQNISLNQALNKQNKTKMIELKAETASNMEILESQARYRFGLIKDGDIYYQINELAPNSADNP